MLTAFFKICSRHRRAVFVVMALVAVVSMQTALCRLLDLHHTTLSGWVETLRNLLLWPAEAALLLLPAIVMPLWWRWVQWPVLLLFTAWGVAQLMYYPTYCDLMPLSSFVLWQNLDSMVVDSALANWQPRCWLFVAPMAALLLADVCWMARGREVRVGRWHWVRLAITLVLVLLMRVAADALAYISFWHKKVTLTEYLNENYTHVKVIHGAYLADNGLSAYMAYCVWVDLSHRRQLTTEQRAKVDQYLAGQPKYTDNSFSAGRDNLIVIVVESLNSWVIGLRVDGREVTPVLNALCADTASLVGLQMKRQVKNGGSSDGLFIYNTGLLPLEQRAVAMVYPDAHYPTLVQSIGCQNTLQVCADPPALWNAQRMAHNYGYNRYVGANELKPKLQPSRWQWDKVVLEAAVDEIAAIQQPFVAQVVTLGMHAPYTQCTVPEGWISQSQVYTEKVRNYLQRTAVFDRELGLFLERLKQVQRYDNSLIVIVSDHSEYVDHDPMGRPAIAPDGRDCLLLVLNSGHGRHLDQPFGQVDVYPTILDLCGANEYLWKGLGNSLLRTPTGSAAMSPVETIGSGPFVHRQQQAWQVARLMIEGNGFAAVP